MRAPAHSGADSWDIGVRLFEGVRDRVLEAQRASVASGGIPGVWSVWESFAFALARPITYRNGDHRDRLIAAKARHRIAA
jgi:hypothetical protein